AGDLDEPFEQEVPDPLAAPGPIDVDRDVRHVVVGRPWVEDVETGPTDHGPALLRHDHGMARVTSGQPLPPFIGAAQLGLERRDSLLDSLVVDGADRACVVLSGQTDPDLGHRPPPRPDSTEGLGIREMNCHDPDDEQYFLIADGPDPRSLAYVAGSGPARKLFPRRGGSPSKPARRQPAHPPAGGAHGASSPGA